MKEPDLTPDLQEREPASGDTDVGVNDAEFWAPRQCFRRPVPEIDQAATLLSEAADALLEGDYELAHDRAHKADMPVLGDYADSIMGKSSEAIHRRCSIETVAIIPALRTRDYLPAELSEFILSRDGWRCRFCGCRIVTRKARDKLRKVLPDTVRWGSCVKDCHTGLYALSVVIGAASLIQAPQGSEAKNCDEGHHHRGATR